MEQLATGLFLINIAWITTHELDAIHHHEWRILPLTSWMNDIWGYRVFVLAHIPLMIVLMWGITSREFQIIFDVFLVIHVGLHGLFRNHPHYTFNNRLSVLLIVGVVPFAILHLMLIV